MPRRLIRAGCALAAAVALVAFPARADPHTPWRIGFVTAEILIPDLRLELAPGAPARWLLSWPIAPFALNLEWPPFDPETQDEYLSSWVNLEIEPFVEHTCEGVELLVPARTAQRRSWGSRSGTALGKIDEPQAVQRAKLAAFVRRGDCLEDPICRRHCLHCTREYNVRANEARRDHPA